MVPARMNTVALSSCQISYFLFGNKTPQCVVIESAIAASFAEWWHLAKAWSKEVSVLVYERAGYGMSSDSKLERTPKNIAIELNELIEALEIHSVILVGHSIGGLYAYQFLKLFPHKVLSLILIDPVSPSNGKFNEYLTREEFAKSGINKNKNLKIAYFVTMFGLGFLFKKLIKKSPPFYYYDKFSKDAESYIMSFLTSKRTYKTAIQEYELMQQPEILAELKIIPSSASIPVFLICHDSEIIKKEIVQFGDADQKTAEKVEASWLNIMKEYLKLSQVNSFIQADKSGHSIHLSNPRQIWNCISASLSQDISR